MLEINVKVLTELINSSSTENTEVQRKTKVPFHFLSSLLRFRTVWDTATQLWIVINHICLLASRSGHYTFQYNIGTSTSCYQTSCDHTCPIPSAQTHTHTPDSSTIKRFAPHLHHQLLQLIRCFPAADADVELAGRDDEFHKDSHQAPALKWWQTAKASVLNSIWRDFWCHHHLV